MEPDRSVTGQAPEGEEGCAPVRSEASDKAGGSDAEPVAECSPTSSEEMLLRKTRRPFWKNRPVSWRKSWTGSSGNCPVSAVVNRLPNRGSAT